MPLSNYCQPNVDSGIGECRARLLDPLTWESNPIDKDWLAFPPNTPIYMHLVDSRTNEAFAGHVYAILPYVSSDGNRNGSDAVLASGNPAIIGWDNGCGHEGPTSCITIHNETCAPLFVRVVVLGSALDAGAIQDSGSDAQDEAGEAGDAANDAPTDSGDAGD